MCEGDCVKFAEERGRKSGDIWWPDREVTGESCRMAQMNKTAAEVTTAVTQLSLLSLSQTTICDKASCTPVDLQEK